MISGQSGLDREAQVVERYCWIQSTHTLTNTSQKCGPVHQQKFIYPGVEQDNGSHERRIHSYYQWVPFMLFLQGILFYLPHWIWKQYEDGKIRNLTDGGRGQIIGPINETNKSRCNSVVEYLFQTMPTYNRLAMVHITCELLNFINVVGNIFFIDRFLNGTFLTYGSRVMQFSDMNQEDRCDPMIQVFPRMTKCSFYKFSPSNNVDKGNALCLLPLNIVNEKIYIFLWFWLIILSVLSGLALVYRIVTLFFPLARIVVLQRQTSLSRKTSETIVWHVPFGGYFILNLLGKNIHTTIFKDLTNDLADRIVSNNLGSKDGDDDAAAAAAIGNPTDVIVYPSKQKNSPNYSIFG